MRSLDRLVVLAAIAFIVATGVCFSGADHAAGGDLCGSFLTTIIALFLASPLLLTGRLLFGLAGGYRLDPRDLPAPPPKL